MSVDPQVVQAARARLLAELREIAGAVARGSLARCPYRDAQDRCTFGAGCRNRRRAAQEWHCTGEALNTDPAPPPDSAH